MDSALLASPRLSKITSGDFVTVLPDYVRRSPVS